MEKSHEVWLDFWETWLVWLSDVMLGVCALSISGVEIDASLFILPLPAGAACLIDQVSRLARKPLPFS